MARVIVGVDPHKKSVTIEAIDRQGQKLGTGRFGTGTRDYEAMLGHVRAQWPHHRWHDSSSGPIGHAPVTSVPCRVVAGCDDVPVAGEERQAA